METIVKFIGGLVLFILNVIIYGFTLMKLWGWFIVSLFGIREIKIVEALGLSLIISFIVQQKTSSTEKDISLIARLFISMILCAFVLLYGWVLTKFL